MSLSPMMRALLTVAVAVAVLTLVPTAGATIPKRFANCKAVNAKYPHGIAKNAKRATSASGLTGRAFVSSKFYGLYGKRLDRDNDGVFCER